MSSLVGGPSMVGGLGPGPSGPSLNPALCRSSNFRDNNLPLKENRLHNGSLIKTSRKTYFNLVQIIRSW